MIVLVLLTTLPFLSKAIHLDDALYLRVAENILQNPLDPYAGTMHWDDPNNLAKPLVEIDFNPPLWKYLLAGTIALLGRSESALHLLRCSSSSRSPSDSFVLPAEWSRDRFGWLA